MSGRCDVAIVCEIRQQVINGCEKARAAVLPSEVASPFKSALKCPMMKTKNVSKADSAGEEKEEKNKATAVRIVSSKYIKKTAGQIFRARGSNPRLT